MAVHLDPFSGVQKGSSFLEGSMRLRLAAENSKFRDVPSVLELGGWVVRRDFCLARLLVAMRPDDFGLKGPATCSKDATRGSWPYY